MHNKNVLATKEGLQILAGLLSTKTVAKPLVREEKSDSEEEVFFSQEERKRAELLKKHEQKMMETEQAFAVDEAERFIEGIHDSNCKKNTFVFIPSHSLSNDSPLASPDRNKNLLKEPESVTVKLFEAQIKKKEFFDVAKSFTNSIERVNGDFCEYLLTCQKLKVKSIPLFSHVLKGKLTISGQFISDAHAIALGKMLNSKTAEVHFRLKEIIFDDNGLKDSAFASILEGLQNTATLRSITYCNNYLGPKSTQLLCEFILKPYPNQIDEIFLNGVNVNIKNLRQVLSSIEESK